MRMDDLRRTFEATLGNLTPSKAQEMARGFLEPGAAKDQVAKTATDLLEWSQKNRERMQGFIRREIQAQLRQMGLATQADVDALRQRVRDLERAGARTAGAKRTSTPASGSPAKRPASPGTTATGVTATAATESRRGRGTTTGRARGDSRTDRGGSSTGRRGRPQDEPGGGAAG